MKIFILGATGYIGGDALYAIANAHPEYKITALVRNSEKGAQVASQYPQIELVYGDNESADVIAKEVQKADIVMHFANSADDIPGTSAICTALKSRASSSSPTNPIYYIHTSGTGILCFNDMDRGTHGEPSSKIYDDWTHISELTSLPDHAPHRNVDKIVLGTVAAASNPASIKTAIVAPPCIYGPGRGPGNKTSMQVPELSALTLREGHGVQVGAGKTPWCGVHVHDLSTLYLKLVEAAAAGGAPATWGPEEGYYFCESGDIVWGEVAAVVARTAKKLGFIGDEKVVSYSRDEIEKLHSGGSVLWGSSSRCRAIRARKLLGWEAKGPKIEETVEETVREVARKEAVVVGHAKVAVGEA